MRILDKTLKLHCFLKKKSTSVHRYKPQEVWFKLHCFFLEPKTAYLEALLYFELLVLELLILILQFKVEIVENLSLLYEKQNKM